MKMLTVNKKEQKKAIMVNVPLFEAYSKPWIQDRSRK